MERYKVVQTGPKVWIIVDTKTMKVEDWGYTYLHEEYDKPHSAKNWVVGLNSGRLDPRVVEWRTPTLKESILFHRQHPGLGKPT
jgi:hypothetical protein